MNRKIVSHMVSGDQAVQLQIEVMDEPGAGGANHWYEISDGRGCIAKIIFQNGPIKEVGVNGITNEALLAIVIDRLEGFDSGAFRTRENNLAKTNAEQSLMWLQKRTRDRIARGVEGTNVR